MRSAWTASLCAWVPDLDQLFSAQLTAGSLLHNQHTFEWARKIRGAGLWALYLWRLLKSVKCQWDEVSLIGGHPEFFCEVRGKEYQHQHHRNKISGRSHLLMLLMKCFARTDSHTSQPHHGLLLSSRWEDWSSERLSHLSKATQLVSEGVMKIWGP